MLQKAAETTKRCEATVFINVRIDTPTGPRNSTVAFDRDGNEAGRYDKQHLVPSEMNVSLLDKEYTWDFSEPTLLEIDGVRYGFLICYDNYFYELFANIARYNPDVIIVCSHQRSDTHDALETITKFCAYNCNAYVVRASVSLGADSPLGGCSMIVGPDGSVFANMKNDIGLATAEFDPHKRYLKPAGFGNPLATHHTYIEDGRRPWKYRPGGSAIVRHDAIMPYPRLCAHRGFNTIAPENSLPAFGAAVALGAEEIEFDLWPTRDGEVVSIHDSKLDRISDGTGKIWEYTYEELLKFDFGIKHSEEYAGLRIPRFEEILKRFACHTVMNIHIKTYCSEEWLKKIVDLIKKYDCKKYCYFMSRLQVLLKMRELAPDIARCTGADDEADLVDKALQVGAQKIQLYKPHFAKHGDRYLQEIIPRAHANGMKVNLFWSDDPAETEYYLRLGVDTVLTNDYWRNAQVLEKFKQEV